MPKNPLELVPDFWTCNSRLWRDKLGQISLATTDAVLGRERQPALHHPGLERRGAGLQHHPGLFAGRGGRPSAPRRRHHCLGAHALDMATQVIPMGILMGVLIIVMNFISNVWVAAPFLILMGALGGFLVVPMNALLQHRGHNLMGAGRSIAVQNFNEQACILGLGAFYSLSTGMGMSAFGAITGVRLVVAGVMWLIMRWHQSNTVKHKEEVDHLLQIARHDNPHG
jgi:hypothetical protein